MNLMVSIKLVIKTIAFCIKLTKPFKIHTKSSSFFYIFHTLFSIFSFYHVSAFSYK